MVARVLPMTMRNMLYSEGVLVEIKSWGWLVGLYLYQSTSTVLRRDSKAILIEGEAFLTIATRTVQILTGQCKYAVAKW